MTETWKWNSNRVEDFEETYSDLPPWVDISVATHIVEFGGRLHLMVEILEDTTRRSIIEGIPDVLELRDRLLEWQGPDPRYDIRTGFLERLLRRHEKRISYAQLADELNQQIAKHLRVEFEFRKKAKAARTDLMTSKEYSEWLGAGKWFEAATSLRTAQDILSWVRFEDEDVEMEVESVMREGLERIAAGEAPFEKGYPISEERIKSTLKAWCLGRKHGAIKRPTRRARSGQPKKRR